VCCEAGYSLSLTKLKSLIRDGLFRYFIFWLPVSGNTVIQLKIMKYYLIISSLVCLGIFLSCSASETESENSTMILQKLPQINDGFHPRGVSDFSLLISSAQFSRASS